MIQQKIWIPLGIAIIMLAALKKLRPSKGMGVANMWCTHKPKPMNAVAISDKHHRGITENSPAGKCLNNRRNQAGRRNENDVNLGMAEEPKQVLIQQRVAAFGRD